ncbi:NAD(P)-dependent oxidoreductase [Pseudonocardia aurantiaca]|uniref:NAD(P)-dependent oxidoreductase n=1 Tax=Pseudonocardia aurantiaca TaxID=75290 RepID=A0ABW4FJ42_9PSEU
MPDTSPRVAVIGLGSMGLPMALRLATAFPVTAFDVADARRDAVEAGGVIAARTPAEAAADADIALLAVRDEAQARSALFGPDGVVGALREGGLVILTSTVGPDAARDLAVTLAGHSLDLVDAPISGGPARAGNGDLLVVVGAPREPLERARPILEHLASTLTTVGDRPGDGQAMKAINQLLAGVHIAAAAEAVALARGLGLDPEQVVDTLGAGAAGSFMLSDRGPRMLQAYGDGAEVRSRLDIFVKDMGIVTGIGRETQVPLLLAAAAHQLYLLGAAQGLAAEDDSTVVTVLSPRP